MTRARDLLERRVLPSTVIAASELDAPARLVARAQRAAGRRARIELYVAFDDPSSAVALVDLAGRTAAREVELDVRPVLRRGPAGDPAVEDKRRYAVLDAGRRARRLGLELRRTAPLDPDAAAFLAGWVAHVPPAPAVTAFAVAAARHLWCEDDGPVARAWFLGLWNEHVGGLPVDDEGAVRRNERRMSRRGPYDTPAAVCGGRWWFAHDRPEQVVARLDELGWT